MRPSLANGAVGRRRNRAIETAQVIEELIKLAREMREAQARGEDLGLTNEELAFYEALGLNDAALKFMGEPVLKAMAKELTETIRRNVTIDWTQRETARAKLRTLVKRLLRKYKYPPDRQEKATQTVMEQAERLCETWAEDGLLVAPVPAPRGSAGDVVVLPVQGYPEDAAQSLPMAAEHVPKLRSSAKEPKPRGRRK